MFKLYLFLLIVGVVSLVQCKLPADIEQCPTTDEKCILKNINHIFQSKLEGDPEFGLVKLKPAKAGNLDVKNNANRALGISLNVQNILLYGMEDFKATKIKGFNSKPEGTYEIILTAPVLHLMGDYKIDGKVIILPVVGEGRAKLTLVEPVITVTFKGKSQTKDGKMYLDVTSAKVDYTRKTLQLHFDNLFNGDKVLGDEVNKLLNQEWKIVEEELAEPLKEAIAVELLAGVKSVFSKTPYNEIFKISE